MTAFEIAMNLFNNSDTLADPEYRMTEQEAKSLIREYRCCADDDESAEYDGITAEELAYEYNALVEEHLAINAQEDDE